MPYWIAENKKYTDISASALNSAEKAKIIAAARKSFNAYGPDWKKSYFDERSGGYYVVHRLHQFSRTGGGGAAELAVGEMLAKYNGKQVEFLPESGGNNRADFQFDGMKWDVKLINTANTETIRKYIKNARKADCAIFYWDKESAKLEELRAAVDKEVARLSKLERIDEMPDVFYMKNGLLRLIWKK